jgi:membrane associated rhomboid family serine protease
MPRYGSTPFAFPEFHGATRRLVLWNLGAYFALLLGRLALPGQAFVWSQALQFLPSMFLLQGAWWQPLTYSFIHLTMMSALFDLLSLWFVAGFLENAHSARWVMGLYGLSVLGTAAGATAIYVCSHSLGFAVTQVPLSGCVGGVFGLLVAIGALYGDTQFMLFPLPMGIKARYLVAIYALITIAMLFGEEKMYAFAQLGGALAGLLYVRLAPRGGLTLGLSERWYALRNRYYRWKRRRAARKFEVYMRKQGRTVRFDGQGRQLDDDANDKKRWN